MARDITRIYICGPHSTGKTTLQNDVLPHLQNIEPLQEVARGIIKQHGWVRDDFRPDKHPEVFHQLNKEILEKQIEVDKEYHAAGRSYIADRALDPLVYAGFYVGEEARRDLLTIPGVQDWLEGLRRSLVFLIAPHPECISDDNVRLTSSLNELRDFYDAIEQELKLQKIPYLAMTELDRQKRVRQVLDAVSSRIQDS